MTSTKKLLLIDDEYSQETPHDVDYITAFEWERLYDGPSYRRWMRDNWTLSLFVSAIYLLLIFIGQSWMTNRSPFKLRKYLFIWNTALSLFSIIAFIRTVPELFYVVTTFGFHYSVCVRANHNHSHVTAFWIAVMILWSKIIELGDTAFIVLRKKPLIFLHWYHHITVLIYGWVTYAAYEQTNLYFSVINVFVHSFMYSYYALKALQLNIPRNFAMAITILQLSQFVVGVTINGYALWLKVNNGNNACNVGYFGIILSFGMYTSYLLLFSNFFYKSYFVKSKRA